MNPKIKLNVQYASSDENLPTPLQFRKWAKAALNIDTEITVRIVSKQEGV